PRPHRAHARRRESERPLALPADAARHERKRARCRGRIAARNVATHLPGRVGWSADVARSDHPGTRHGLTGARHRRTGTRRRRTGIRNGLSDGRHRRTGTDTDEQALDTDEEALDTDEKALGTLSALPTTPGTHALI